MNARLNNIFAAILAVLLISFTFTFFVPYWESSRDGYAECVSRISFQKIVSSLQDCVHPHRVLYVLIGGVLNLFFNDSHMSTSLLSFIFFILILFLLKMDLSNPVYNKAWLLFSFNVISLIYIFASMTTMIETCFVYLSLIFFRKSIITKDSINSVLAGFFAGASIMIREMLLVLTLFYGIYLCYLFIIQKNKALVIKQAIIIGSIIFLTVSSFLVITGTLDSFITRFIGAYDFMATYSDFGKIYHLFGTLFMGLNLFWLPLCRKLWVEIKKKPIDVYLGFIIVYLIFFGTFLQSYLIRYLSVILPITIVWIINKGSVSKLFIQLYVITNIIMLALFYIIFLYVRVF